MRGDRQREPQCAVLEQLQRARLIEDAARVDFDIAKSRGDDDLLHLLAVLQSTGDAVQRLQTEVNRQGLSVQIIGRRGNFAA